MDTKGTIKKSRKKPINGVPAGAGTDAFIFFILVISMVKKKTLAGSGRTVAKLKEKQARKQQPARQATLQAMVWYKEEHYEQLLSMFDDAELLPLTYQDWLVRAEEKKAEVEAAGDQVIKVFIDPETFSEWCEKKELLKDANARSQLAIEVAQAQSFRL
jgi:hypothetical protein